MSKERIRWIVVLMAIGLLGLVGFQLYWITNALHLQQEQFTFKVTDALQEVVRTLERQEIVYLTQQRLRAQQQQHRLREIGRGTPAQTPQPGKRALLAQATSPANRTQVGQSANHTADQTVTYRRKLMPNPTMTTPTDVLHPTPQPLTPEQQQVIVAFFQQQNELMAVGDWQTQLLQQQQFDQWVDQVLVGQLAVMNDQMRAESSRPDSISTLKSFRLKRLRARQLVETAEASADASARGKKLTPEPNVTATRSRTVAEQKTEEQSKRIKDMMKGLLLSDRPINERVNRLTLDTLLRQALQEQGVTISFDYGVEATQTGFGPPHFLFASHGVDITRFAREGYKAALFPNNILETGNYVYVYFPDQQQFIWGRMGLTLAGSAVLILVIMVCFYVAITTIVRQKKLADIKNDFINNMTHEFKTPISTISLAVEMAQEQLKARSLQFSGLPSESPLPEPDIAQPDPRLTRYLGIVRDEIRRLGAHVEKVLQMAMLDKGEIKLKLGPVNIHDAIENVLNNIGLQIEQRGGELDLVFDAENEIIEADELHLTNILYNLVDNAIKYSPDQPHLTIQTRSLPTGVSISVSDRGLGMTNEQISRIFETFYRVPTGNRHDVKGFGLGLSYVRKMVDEHHGQVRVESQPGQGSTFEVILPYSMREGIDGAARSVIE